MSPRRDTNTSWPRRSTSTCRIISREQSFGLELVQRCRRNNEGTEFAEPLAELTVEIAEDRQTLRRVMRDIGAVSRTKVAAGWRRFDG
jgi:hypothetical protein